MECLSAITGIPSQGAPFDIRPAGVGYFSQCYPVPAKSEEFAENAKFTMGVIKLAHDLPETSHDTWEMMKPWFNGAMKIKDKTGARDALVPGWVGGAAGATIDAIEIEAAIKLRDYSLAANKTGHLAADVMRIGGMKASADVVEDSSDFSKAVFDFNTASKLQGPGQGWAAGHLEAKLEARQHAVKFGRDIEEIKGPDAKLRAERPNQICRILDGLPSCLDSSSQ